MCNCFKQLVLSLLMLCCVSGLSATTTQLVRMQGHLGAEQVSSIASRLDEWTSSPPKEIVLVLHSRSGDMESVLSLSQKLFQLREQGTKITTYLDQEVLGPAAILPYVADVLGATSYVSWGAVTLEETASLPVNILRNRVLSLIDPQHPKAALLRLLAQAMVDESVAVVSNGSWRLARQSEKDEANIISPKGETLVISHIELESLGLVESVESLNELLPKKEEKSSEVTLEEQRLVDARFEDYIHTNPDKPTTVGHILIDDRTSGINQGTWLYVKSALDYYKKTKPAFIILELNTPGGQVYAAQLISDALKNMDVQYDIPVVTYINNWAISAGAMLAYSTRFIAISKDASMGAAEPVLQSSEGTMVTASEKINSALRSEFANRARFFGRNALLAEAMVDKDIILVRRYGDIVKLNDEDQIRHSGPNRDEVISAKGKLLTLNAQEMMDLGLADIRLESVQLPPITDKEKDQGQWPAEKEPLFTDSYLSTLKPATIDSFRPDWRVRFLGLLAHPMVSSMLFLGLFMGFYMEVSSPGFGLPGAVAIVCLFGILLSSFALEAASALEFFVILGGLVLLAIEVFVIPGFGVAGFAGSICLVVGLFALVLPEVGDVTFDWDTNTWNSAGEVFMERLAWLCAALVFSIIAMGMLGRYVLPKFNRLNPLILQGEQESSQGYYTGINRSLLPKPGSRGEAASALRPSGRVSIGDTFFEARSEEGWIDIQEAIEVVELEGSRLIVRRAQPKGEND